MSQYDFGDLESPLSGTTFFNTHLEPWRDALHSSHKGNSRPSYATAGMIWVNDATTPWVLNLYDGAADIPLGTINATDDWFKPTGTSNWAGSAGGTANVLTLTPTIPITAYAAGQEFEFLVTAASTSETITANVSAKGAKAIKCSVGVGKVNLPKGALQSGMIAHVVYDGTDLILLNIRANNVSAAIATASTVNLNNSSGDYVELTGTTSVTAITLAEGQERTCISAGAFTLTDGASLILPTGANISVVAGDVFVVRGEASSVVRVVSYTRADGSALAGSTASGIAKAWVNFNGIGTVAIRDSYNVSSITDNNTGDYTVNLSVTMANTDFCPVVMSKQTNAAGTAGGWQGKAYNASTSSVRVATGGDGTTSSALFDNAVVNVAVFGDLS